MMLDKVERDGEMTQARVMMNEKLTKQVESYLVYYEATTGVAIDLREFGLLAFKAILKKDTDFQKWLRLHDDGARKMVKVQKGVVVNGQAVTEVRE